MKSFNNGESADFLHKVHKLLVDIPLDILWNNVRPIPFHNLYCALQKVDIHQLLCICINIIQYSDIYIFNIKIYITCIHKYICIRYLYKLRSVCLSEAVREIHVFAEISWSGSGVSTWNGHSQQKRISGSTADAYQNLHRALALTTHEYQQKYWYQQRSQCFRYILRIPRMGSSAYSD